MAYFEKKSGVGGNSKLNDTGLGSIMGNSMGDSVEFYEMEPGIVLDIILDENHPVLKNKKIDVSSFPDNYDNTSPSPTDVDYTWIGRALVRMVNSQQAIAKERLNWALPLDVSGIIEYPLINEPVVVVKYFGNLYYTKRLNLRNFINNCGDYKFEKVYGINNGLGTFGPQSLLTNKTYINNDYIGSLGSYFLSNNFIRRLKKYEGDTTIESRFGQSIRFGAYDDNRQNDKGDNANYIGDTTLNPPSVGGGNPMILIRNRQRLIASNSAQQQYPKLPPIPPITNSEKNVGGLINEDINNDGSSIHMTSGLTVSKWQPTVYKSMFGVSEEQSAFNGSSTFQYPILDGDQIIINSDRLILSSRFGETFHYSKKRYGVVTDSEITMDAQDQIVITTNNKTVINSPEIYLGQYDQTSEPVLLGQTTVNWMFQLCGWLLAHTHLYNHTHPDAQGGDTGNSNANITQMSIEQQQLIALQTQLNELLSRRVFVTGGGFAPGANGGTPSGYDGTGQATTINVVSGEGVSGGFSGTNYK
jgi:hypothetical protein